MNAYFCLGIGFSYAGQSFFFWGGARFARKNCAVLHSCSRRGNYDSNLFSAFSINHCHFMLRTHIRFRVNSISRDAISGLSHFYTSFLFFNISGQMGFFFCNIFLSNYKAQPLDIWYATQYGPPYHRMRFQVCHRSKLYKQFMLRTVLYGIPAISVFEPLPPI